MTNGRQRQPRISLDGRRVAIFGLMILAGCQSADERRLSGVWEMDTEKTLAERLGGDAEAESSETEESESRGEITISFLAGGVLETATRTNQIDSRKKGKWRLLSSDAVKKTMLVECDLMNQTTTHTIQWLDDDSMKMTPPNLAGLSIQMKFRRK